MVLPACPFANKALVATNVSILLANWSCLAAAVSSCLRSAKANCLSLLASSADLTACFSISNVSLAALLAADLAYAITNNATLAKNYEATADERLREARFIDATENSLGTVESSEFTDARL